MGGGEESGAGKPCEKIKFVPGDDDEQLDLNSITSAICPHCGALNTFPGFDSVDVFMCAVCGEPVKVEIQIQ
jgi:hypothetical protein